MQGKKALKAAQGLLKLGFIWWRLAHNQPQMG